jgi:hypothetical protein
MSVYAILDLVGVVIGLVVTAASGFIVLRG